MLDRPTESRAGHGRLLSILLRYGLAALAELARRTADGI